MHALFEKNVYVEFAVYNLLFEFTLFTSKAYLLEFIKLTVCVNTLMML